MARALDWTKARQNDLRRQVIRDERDQWLCDAERPLNPDEAAPVNWALERWRAKVRRKYGLVQHSTPAAPRPRPRRSRKRSPSRRK
jgi:hypothetical protein